MKRSIIISSIATLCLLYTSCKDKNTPTPNENKMSKMTLKFDNIVGDANLQLNTGSYTNAMGQQFNITTLKYYISNIKLTKTDGSIYTVPQDSSYFLVSEENNGSDWPKFSIPEGDYNKLEFVLGVDSLRNTMDISKRTGVLDPAGAGSGMYWSWNSGYIFYKMEGKSNALPDSTDQIFRYHIGGFGGYSSPTFNNLKTITLDLTDAGIAKPRIGRTCELHILVDALKTLNGISNVNFTTHPSVMINPFSVNIANNYANAFKHEHTHN